MSTTSPSLPRIPAGVPDQFDTRRGPPGRRALPPDRRRRWRVRVALRDDEREQIERRAALAGQRLGPHLRSCALIGSASAATLIDALVRTLAQARGVVGNLNQTSHRANLLIAQAKEAGLDLAGLQAEQRSILALEREVRDWMQETRAILARFEGRD